MLSKDFFSTPIQYIKGVGPRLAEVFHKKNIYTVHDLLSCLPRSYRDQKCVTHLKDLNEAHYCIIKGEVVSKKKTYLRGKGAGCLIQMKTRQEESFYLRYFKIPFRGFLDSMEIGTELKVGGVAHINKNKYEFHHPDFLSTFDSSTGITPIYSEIEGIHSMKLKRVMNSAVEKLKEAKDILDPLPSIVREENSHMSYQSSLIDIHQPASDSLEEYLNYKAPCQQAFIFYEFFILQLHLQLRRMKLKKKEAPILLGKEDTISSFKKSLPFDLTSAQKKVFDEIKEDLESSTPMARLLQGDVGSGKTLVALMAVLHASQSGYQSAIMVPTEILAEQHAQTAKKWLEPMSIRVEFLTSKTKNRSKILEKMKNGECDLCVGTHALFQDVVQFKQLGLTIIDEQHRFGVEQRNKFLDKGLSPHCLVMTATPIPRSLAMTLYGDLDISVIDEKPQNRKPVITRKTKKRKKVFDFLEKEISKGRQGYIVYPLVEESEKIDLKNAKEQFEKLKQGLPSIRWGLLHGKMAAEEKSKMMQDFYSGLIQVLVTTTVIEVGVDIPNATIMIVEHCERFGLSQLHQLRGRVGRGEYQSYCILVLSQQASKEASMRAQVMEETQDGFKIANEDLKMRGAGEFLGTRQSGITHFQMASFIRDSALLTQARAAAQKFLEVDMNFQQPEHLGLKMRIQEVERIRQA